MQLLKKYFHKVNSKDHTEEAIAFLAGLDVIAKNNPEIAKSILRELEDQRSYVKLIASENYSSLAVQLAMGNLLTDKYSEGYVHHRFYAGCENVDTIEALAIDRLKEIFGVDHAYVQPHSGADANLIALWAILTHKIENEQLKKWGKKNSLELSSQEYEEIRLLFAQQKVMGLSLNSGGHLTHGYRLNVSAKMMQAVLYEVDPVSHLLDYQKLAKQVKEEKPLILIAGYSAYSRRINFAKMREIADSVGAVLFVDMAHFAGLVAGGVFTGEENPVPYADIITSTTHKTLRGPRGGIILCTNEYKEMVDKGCPLVMGGPMPHVMAAKAIAFQEIQDPSFSLYAQRIVENARSLAAALSSLGVSVLTGGTDNHLVLFDVYKSFGLTGRQAELSLREAQITVNRNCLPADEMGPWYTSGVRIGTPAVTTLGMGAVEMKVIAKNMVKALKSTRAHKEGQTISKAKYEIDQKQLLEVKKEISSLLSTYPLYPELIIDF